jgi:hypothetical protein
VRLKSATVLRNRLLSGQAQTGECGSHVAHEAFGLFEGGEVAAGGEFVEIIDVAVARLVTP